MRFSLNKRTCLWVDVHVCRNMYVREVLLGRIFGEKSPFFSPDTETARTTPGTDTRMSSPEENTPKDERPDDTTGPKPAGRQALERALSESGKDLEDLTR